MYPFSQVLIYLKCHYVKQKEGKNVVLLKKIPPCHSSESFLLTNNIKWGEAEKGEGGEVFFNLFSSSISPV